MINNEQKLLGDYYYVQEERERAFQDAIQFPFFRKPETYMRPSDRLPEPFRIGVPKSKGEFNGGIIQWARQYGFDYSEENTRRLSFSNRNGSTMFLMRTTDIMDRLFSGELTYGLVGAEKIFEQSVIRPYVPVQPLCFGASMFCLGFREEEYPTIETPNDMETYIRSQLAMGKTIATSLPKTLEYALPISPKQTYILDGSVEAAFALAENKVFATADIVESGETSMANGIRADYRLMSLPGAFVVRCGVQKNDIVDKSWDKLWNGSYWNN